MITLSRYNLNFESVYAYFKNNLQDTNELSTSLIKLIDFRRGDFFTLLPKDTDRNKIHEFIYGGVACGVKNYTALMILNKIIQDESLTCIFDNTTETFNSEYVDTLYTTCGLFYGDEIYYSIYKPIASYELMQQCFYASNAIWHSLCLISRIRLDDKDIKELSTRDIENICKNSRLIIIGAYDDEGYVFWEPTFKS